MNPLVLFFHVRGPLRCAFRMLSSIRNHDKKGYRMPAFEHFSDNTSSVSLCFGPHRYPTCRGRGGAWHAGDVRPRNGREPAGRGNGIDARHHRMGIAWAAATIALLRRALGPDDDVASCKGSDQRHWAAFSMRRVRYEVWRRAVVRRWSGINGVRFRAASSQCAPSSRQACILTTTNTERR